MFRNRILPGALLLSVLGSAPLLDASAQTVPELSPQTLETAQAIVRASGAPGGFIAVIGSTDASLAVALAKQGSFTVHCLSTDARQCDALRQSIRARGLYGTVSASTLENGRLPYVGSLINILVVEGNPALAKRGLTAKDSIRVLAPLGTVFVSKNSTARDSAAWFDTFTTQLGTAGGKALSGTPGAWAGFQKPWPAEIDEWSHYLHGADGNPVAQDRVVGPPVNFQWINSPTWLTCHETDSAVSTLVTSQGRLFAIANEFPIGLAGPNSPPDKWSLIARDAFNGVDLWKVPIRHWGWREWKATWWNTRPGDIPLNIQKRLVAAGDKVYVTLGYHAPVSQLDARTGEILQTYPGTEGTVEVLHLNGTLVLSVLDGKQVKVMAVEAASGKPLWVTKKSYRGSTVDYIKWGSKNASTDAAELDSTLNLATDGKSIAFIDGPEIAALDFRTGAEKWHAAFPQDELDKSAGGIQTEGNLWVGTMIVRDGVVVHASPNKLAGLSADSGKVLWSQPKKYIGHLWYEWKDVFVIGDLVWTWGAELGTEATGGAGKKERTVFPKTANGYDLKTGALKKEVPLGLIFAANHHHRCYRNKATTQYILASRRGTEFVDLTGGKHTVDNWVRSTCHVGMMPANGLQYVPPHPCQCYIDEKLTGFFALAPARSDEDQLTPLSAAPQLEKGPAFGAVDPKAANADLSQEWPAFRHDSMRTGSVKTRVPDDLAPLWRVKAGGKISPPIAVGGRLYVSLVDEHHVACLDANAGHVLWEAAAGGRVDSPPTYHKGTVLFGSADGWVYCLRATDGQLVWRFRAAPAQRLMGAYGQFESAWPVHGSVLVQDDTAYFAAGRSSHLEGGIRIYGVAAATGELRHQAPLTGPAYTSENLTGNFLPPGGALPDILMGDGCNLYMRGETFDNSLRPTKGQSPLQVKGGFLDDSYFKRTPWTFGSAQNYASMLVNDEQCSYCVRQFDSLKGLDPNIYFSPGDKGYQLYARPMTGNKDAWSSHVPVRIQAMVVADKRLLVAGPPDVIDPQDPLGAFEGRKGGKLYVVNAATGEKMVEHTLASPPVFNGAAAASGRVFISGADGSISCFGQKPARVIP